MTDCHELENQVEQIKCLESKIFELNTKLQATTDFTDDIVGTTGNVLSQADKAIQASSSAMSHADAVLTNYFAVFSILVALAIFLAGLWIKKSSKSHIKKASDKIANDLMNNDEFVSKFAREMLKNDGLMVDNLMKNIAKITQDLVVEQVGKSNNAMKETLHDLANKIG